MKNIVFDSSLLVSFCLISGCASDLGKTPDYSKSCVSCQNAEDTEDACGSIESDKGYSQRQDVKNGFECAMHEYHAPFDGNQSSAIDDLSDGYYGVIDKGCFQAGAKSEYGGDIDYIKVNAASGTPLKIEVSNILGSKINPLVTIYDSIGQSIFLGQPKNNRTKLELFAPGDVFYVGIEDLDNYIKRYGGCDREGKFNGGADFSYQLIITNDNHNQITEIDVRDKGTKEINEDVNGSEIKYYKIVMPHGSPLNYHIESLNNNSECELTVSYEDTGHLWKVVGNQLKKDAQGVISSDLATSISGTEDSFYTLIVFNLSGLDKCKYRLTVGGE